MAVDIGLNFRGTEVYVTDGAGETHVLEGDTYPTTRDGVTFGWEDGASDGRDRDSTIDARLAGIHFTANTLFERFRVDLDSAVSHDINAAFGDADFAAAADFEMRDDTTVFESHDVATAAKLEFIDAGGTVRTSVSDWVSNNTQISRTFTSTIFRMAMVKPVSASFSRIAHLKIAQAAASGASLLLMQKSFRQ